MQSFVSPSASRLLFGIAQKVTNELQREFASEDLSAKVRVNPEYSWHPKWGRGDTGASEFIIGTGPYSQIVYQTLTCLTLMSPSNRGAAALTAAIRFSDEEITLIFYAGATLAGRWADIRSLVETTHFFSYHPKILDLILPEGVIAQLMEHWGWSPDAWLPSRKKTP